MLDRTRKQFLKLSTNEVQKDFIDEVYQSLIEPGDDLYDFCNYAAALRKMADHLEQKVIPDTFNGMDLDLPGFINAAALDWPNGDNPVPVEKHPIESTKKLTEPNTAEGTKGPEQQ